MPTSHFWHNPVKDPRTNKWEPPTKTDSLEKEKSLNPQEFDTNSLTRGRNA